MSRLPSDTGKVLAQSALAAVAGMMVPAVAIVLLMAGKVLLAIVTAVLAVVLPLAGLVHGARASGFAGAGMGCLAGWAVGFHLMPELLRPLGLALDGWALALSGNAVRYATYGALSGAAIRLLLSPAVPLAILWMSVSGTFFCIAVSLRYLWRLRRSQPYARSNFRGSDARFNARSGPKEGADGSRRDQNTHESANSNTSGKGPSGKNTGDQSHRDSRNDARSDERSRSSSDQGDRTGATGSDRTDRGASRSGRDDGRSREYGSYAGAPDFDASDPYAVLGVSKDIDFATLRSAWRRAMHAEHPDRSSAGNATDRAQRINRAFSDICHARRWGRQGARPD